jgi:uncharacterized protein
MDKLALPVLLLLLLAAAPALPAPPPDYRAEVESWRLSREETLRKEGGWLSVAGLFWLEDGPNHFGTEATNDIVLPAGSTPPRAGVLDLSGGKVTVRVEPGVEATIGGKPLAGSAALAPDTSGKPDELRVGRLSLTVIDRSGKLGIRLRDPEAPQRKAFKGLTWFPVDPAWRVTARFEPYSPPKQIPIANVLGQVNQMQSPGALVFTVKGQTLRLDPVLEDPEAKELFIMFKDPTSGKLTYGAGRFLYTELPKNGTVVVDFNRAYSPPCAFTPFATCPLPPPQNRLPLPIEAGEKKPDVLGH